MIADKKNCAKRLMDVVEQTVNTFRQCFPHIDFTLAERPGIFIHPFIAFQTFIFVSVWENDAAHDWLTGGQSSLALWCYISSLNAPLKIVMRHLLLKDSSKTEAPGRRSTRPTMPKHQFLTSLEWDSNIPFSHKEGLSLRLHVVILFSTALVSTG